MARKAKTLTEADKAVVDLIGELLDDSGLSGRALADKLEMSLKRVQTILNGGTPAPTIGEAVAIVSALGVPVPDFLAEAERRIAAGEHTAEVGGLSEPAAPLQGYRTRWAGVREPHRRGPAIGEQERMAALAGSADEDFGYPADAGEEPQD